MTLSVVIAVAISVLLFTLWVGGVRYAATREYASQILIESRTRQAVFFFIGFLGIHISFATLQISKDNPALFGLFFLTLLVIPGTAAFSTVGDLLTRHISYVSLVSFASLMTLASTAAIFMAVGKAPHTLQLGALVTGALTGYLLLFRKLRRH